MIITLLIIAWAGIGIASIIYWWTDNMPVTVEELFMIILAGSVLGVFAFIFFALPVLMGEKWHIWSSEKVLIRARDNRISPRNGRYENYNDNVWPGEEDE